MSSTLGRLEPPDFEHVEKYPLSALTPRELPKKAPVVIGINWYASFDTPVQHSNGTWWIEKASGGIRGGHAICVKPDSMSDYTEWWDFYNQKLTGMCVGYSSSRMMTLLNRARYDAPWLYYSAQDDAGQPHNAMAGTYVRSGGRVLRDAGHKTPAWQAPRLTQGISAYRWATSIDEINSVLGSPNQVAQGAFNLLNSWGRAYPHIVRLPFELANTLLFRENGECMVPTDR
jgi:hypothetical protein